jgi:predicted RNA binding protein YcfA (HicA-like mRNA interferase family)
VKLQRSLNSRTASIVRSRSGPAPRSCKVNRLESYVIRPIGEREFLHSTRTTLSVKVRDAIRLLESKGWRHLRTKGSHRQYRHPDSPKVITVAGHPGDDVPQAR